MKPLSGIYTLTFPTGAIYVGKTNDFVRRVEEHRKKLESGTAAKLLQAELSKLSSGNELSFSLVVECHEDHIDLMEDIYIRQAKADYGSLCLNTTQRKALSQEATDILLKNVELLNNSTADHLQLLKSHKITMAELQERIDFLENTEEMAIELVEVEADLAETTTELYKAKCSIEFLHQQLQLEKSKSWWTRLWE